MADDEKEEKPSAAEVAQLKSKYEGRSLHRVEFGSDEDPIVFVITGPTRTEWKKYRQEVAASVGNLEKTEEAIEKAALAQIRWPSREEVKAIFEANPGLIQHFGDELAKAAKAEVEVRTKKL